MKLVVVESPSKAKTIEKYLGKGFEVLASKGHIIDLPKSKMGVDFDNDFEPTYVVTNKKSLTALKKAYKKAKELYIATDYDREGEAIGWHVAERLGAIKDKKPLHRIVFTEITKPAIKDAVGTPREIDMSLVNAQEARRILDRVVGYTLSPLLWKKIRYGLSAGRVQSVALRLIVDRELERDAFDPEEYWTMSAYTLIDKPARKKKPKTRYIESEDDKPDQPQDTINFELFKLNAKRPQLETRDQVEKVVKKVIDQKWVIDSIEKNEVTKKPKPPFITSTLQRTASSWFGYTARSTMSTAQKLYEAGHITYMRTDSTNLAATAVKSIRKHIESEFGDKYLPAKQNHYGKKSKNAQEAHEAIRPTKPEKSAKQLKLKGPQAKLYDLIRGRVLASQMVPAKLTRYKILVDVKPALFASNSQSIEFDGYLAAYPEKVKNDPPVDHTEGAELYLHTVDGIQNFTQPPSRYTESSLIKLLESEGIGRPSTYASIISTIESRGYVERENKSFYPTDTGRVVTQLLKDGFEDIVDTSFTADMENKLDRVADGKQDWVKMLQNFYNPFIKNFEKQEKELKKDDYTVLGKAPKDVKCPDCGGAMIIKLGKYGKFYSCKKFPDCKGMIAMDEDDSPHDDEEFLRDYESPPQTDDGRDYELKKSRFGYFWSHPDYPKVKDAKSLQLKPEIIERDYGEAPRTDDDRPFEFRQGKYGPFWAHPDYPKTKKVIKAKKKE